MASTPNFNWNTPDNTGLVKNGALDIRTLGNAIDASLVDLKGGTTGQVLAKQTNTDMDFTWSTPSAGSSQVAGKNAVINGAFDIWQRGTSSNGGAYNYTADRWLNYRSGFTGGSTFSRTTSVPTSFQYGLKIARDSGNTSTAAIIVRNGFETVNSMPLANQVVTLSFYARAGSNYSGGAFVSRIYYGTGTDQATDNMTGWTGGGSNNQNNTLTTSYQRFTQTFTIPSTTTQVGLEFVFTPVGTAGADDAIYMTGVQLEVAATATAFARNAGTIQGELAACQRYYWRFTGGNGNFAAYGTGVTGSTTQCDVFVQFPTTMRTRPTTVEFSTLALADGLNTAAVSTLTVLRSNELGATLAAGATGLIQYRPHQLINNNNSTTAYLGVTAEL